MLPASSGCPSNWWRASAPIRARNVPVLVSIPQLVGGGAVGIAIGDSISIARRSREIADLLAGADVIVESAIALSQEIHDGPFETYTGHGIWAAWDHLPVYTLEEKTLVRVDLDSNPERAWDMERRRYSIKHVEVKEDWFTRFTRPS
jgi:hypothetical protein